MPKKSMTGQLTAEHYVVLALVRAFKNPPTLNHIEGASGPMGAQSPLGEQAEMLVTMDALCHPKIARGSRGEPQPNLALYEITESGERLLAGSAAKQLAELDTRIAAAKPAEEARRLQALREVLTKRCRTGGPVESDEPEIQGGQIEPEDFTDDELNELDEPVRGMAATAPAIKRVPERVAAGGRVQRPAARSGGRRRS